MTGDRLLEALDELESAVAAAELALRRRDNTAFEAALADQRRLHHEISLLEPAENDPQRLEDVRKRVAAVVSFRELQISRLRKYRDAIGKRLSTISQWNRYARSNGAADAPHPSLIDSAR